VGALAGFYVWFIDSDTSFRIALAIPILLSLLGGFRSYATLARIYEIADYLRILDNVFALKEYGLTGWETYRFKPPAERQQVWRRLPAPFRSSAAVFWLVLIGVSLAGWWLPCIVI
jgi:hypothetical protein